MPAATGFPLPRSPTRSLDRSVKNSDGTVAHYNPGIDVLVVCTGNMCRSPMVEALLRDRFGRRNLDVNVSSAGLSTVDQPASEGTVRVMADLDIDLEEHRSQLIDAQLVGNADLVLGMAREHVREAVVLVPDAFGRTFTLKELVRRGRELGPRRASEPIDAWLARAHEGRQPAMHLGASPDDDIEDPMGHRLAVYERVADEVVELVDALVELLWDCDAATADERPHLAAT